MINFDGDGDGHGKCKQTLTGCYCFCRSNPLVVKLFEGDVSRFDCRLADYEAVTLVELLVLYAWSH